ncbi:CDP-2,3-bis-(O-geranylgeranyl)-sn-glycerol synthase [Candidatus Bathyarchaeota archaeon]|nr:CDP-2,3-bis-(O-geranylgeranyl)-sn-glycerol synthase [Candidatus Bathyarchaeota archaeon]
MELVSEAIKFIFPAYCANAIPVLAGGGLPLDLRRKFFDGKPIFGKNKTFRGFFSGLIIGTIAGFAEAAVFEEYQNIGYFGFLLSLGALLGDLAGSFLKRRLGIPPGGVLPIVDQVDFVVGALIFSIPLNILNLELILVVLIITPPLHMATNFAAYKLGLKNSPW